MKSPECTTRDTAGLLDGVSTVAGIGAAVVGVVVGPGVAGSFLPRNKRNKCFGVVSLLRGLWGGVVHPGTLPSPPA